MQVKLANMVLSIFRSSDCEATSPPIGEVGTTVVFHAASGDGHGIVAWGMLRQQYHGNFERHHPTHRPEWRFEWRWQRSGDGGDGDGGTKSSELQAAEKAETDARTAVMEATAAATAAQTNARTKIAEARTALALAVSRARAAYAAAQAGTDNAALGAAKIVLDRVTAYQTAELAKLTAAEAPLFWFTRALAR